VTDNNSTTETRENKGVNERERKYIRKKEYFLKRAIRKRIVQTIRIKGEA